LLEGILGGCKGTLRVARGGAPHFVGGTLELLRRLLQLSGIALSGKALELTGHGIGFRSQLPLSAPTAAALLLLLALRHTALE
jgi:hypothetical protein